MTGRATFSKHEYSDSFVSRYISIHVSFMGCKFCDEQVSWWQGSVAPHLVTFRAPNTFIGCFSCLIILWGNAWLWGIAHVETVSWCPCRAAAVPCHTWPLAQNIAGHKWPPGWHRLLSASPVLCCHGQAVSWPLWPPTPPTTEQIVDQLLSEKIKLTSICVHI